MNQRENKLYSTMIATLQYDGDNYKNGDKLLTILNYSEVELEDTGRFSNKSYHTWEIVNIRVKIPLIKEARILLDTIKNLVQNCYTGVEGHELLDVTIKPKLIDNLDEIEIVTHNALFENIRKEIIEGIRMANHSIWICVAWFSDNIYFEELLKQKQMGINIRVIISNEPANSFMISKLKTEFETIVINNWGYSGYNRMHSKYCIIDGCIVLHGSFNWTPTASNNQEHLTNSVDKILAGQYIDNFKLLYRSSLR